MPDRKGWTAEEDQILRYLREEVQQKKWSTIAKKMSVHYNLPLRNGKQCRERYHNQLDSSIISSEWTPDEDSALYCLHEQFGNKWTLISESLPGRTDNSIKNHFYSRMRKAIRKLNKIIAEQLDTQLVQINNASLYRILECSQSKYKKATVHSAQLIALCVEIKNSLFSLPDADLDPEVNPWEDHTFYQELAKNICLAEKQLKDSQVLSNSTPALDRELLHPNKYQSFKINKSRSSEVENCSSYESLSNCEGSDYFCSDVSELSLMDSKRQLSLMGSKLLNEVKLTESISSDNCAGLKPMSDRGDKAYGFGSIELKPSINPLMRSISTNKQSFKLDVESSRQSQSLVNPNGIIKIPTLDRNRKEDWELDLKMEVDFDDKIDLDLKRERNLDEPNIKIEGNVLDMDIADDDLKMQIQEPESEEKMIFLEDSQHYKMRIFSPQIKDQSDIDEFLKVEPCFKFDF